MKVPGWLLTAVLAAVFPGGVVAQEPLRAGMLGSPRAGRPAPALELGYVTAEGAGPAGQPFRLAAELGRVVVLVFAGGPDSTAARDWREVGGRAEGLVGRSTIVVGVARGPLPTLPALAAAAGEEFKLLADSAGRARRAWGLRENHPDWVVFVVGDDGRLVWSGRVVPEAAAGWAPVEAAVRKGHTALEPRR